MHSTKNHANISVSLSIGLYRDKIMSRNLILSTDELLKFNQQKTRALFISCIQ